MWQTHEWTGRLIKENSAGYLEVYFPEHPYNNDGYMLLHRLVMENYLQRYLDPEIEVVHHVNEDKQCNEIWNLFRCNSSEHQQIHRLGKTQGRKSRAMMSKKHQTLSATRKRNPKGQYIQDGGKI
jgi:hypothetical protein